MKRVRAYRHQSRQVALQVLYAVDLAQGRRAGAGPTDQEVFDDVAANFDLPEGARAFAKQLVAGVSAHREALDARISEHAKNWRLSRMAAVDRNVLRLAVYELVHGDTPASVILDEAVELARRFGDEPSPAFVNGVLDPVARSVRAGELDAAQARSRPRPRRRRPARGADS
jgi:N utilization substance protein B